MHFWRGYMLRAKQKPQHLMIHKVICRGQLKNRSICCLFFFLILFPIYIKNRYYSFLLVDVSILVSSTYIKTAAKWLAANTFFSTSLRYYSFVVSRSVCFGHGFDFHFNILSRLKLDFLSLLILHNFKSILKEGLIN